MIGLSTPKKNTVCHLVEERKTYCLPRTAKCIPTKSTNIGLYGKSMTVYWFWRLDAESSILYRSVTRAFEEQTFGKDFFLPVGFQTNQRRNNQTSLTEHRRLVIEWGLESHSIAVRRLRRLNERLRRLKELQRGQVRNEN